MKKLWRWVRANVAHGWRWGADHPDLSLAEKIRLYVKERAGDD